MATAVWKFVLARSRDLVNLGELTQARDRQLSLVLNRSGSLSFNIPMSDELGSQIYPIEYAVKAYRQGSQGLQLIWSGYVNTVEEDVLNDRMTVNCVGWYDRLAKRLLRLDKSFYQVDDSVIVKWMLGHANAGLEEGEYAPGISSAVMPAALVPGETPYSIHWPQDSSPNTPTWIKWGGVLDDDGGTDHQPPEYAYQDLTTLIDPITGKSAARNQPTLPAYQTVIQSVIQSFSDVENGLDWSIDPATREFFVYRHRRRALPDVVLGYRFGPANVAQFNRQIDGSTLANYGLATGISTVRSVGVYDEESQGYYGSFEEVYSLSTTNEPELLRIFAQGEIEIKKNPRQLFSITPFNWTPENSSPEPFVDYGIGDEVGFVAVQPPRIRINQSVRVFGMSVAIDSEGNEKLGQLQVTPQ